MNNKLIITNKGDGSFVFYKTAVRLWQNIKIKKNLAGHLQGS